MKTKWMPIEEWIKNKEYLDKAEKQILIKKGFGWILKFCKDSQNKKLK